MPGVGGAPDTRHMFASRPPIRLSSRPRVIVVGSQRHPLGLRGEAADLGAEAMHIDASHPARQMLRVAMQASRLIRDEGFEAVHLQDARFAPAAFWLRKRHGVAVSAALGAADVQRRVGMPGGGLRSLARLDEAFVSDPEVIATLRLRAPRLSVTELHTVASPLPLRPLLRGRASLPSTTALLPMNRLTLPLLFSACETWASLPS